MNDSIATESEQAFAPAEMLNLAEQHATSTSMNAKNDVSWTFNREALATFSSGVVAAAAVAPDCFCGLKQTKNPHPSAGAIPTLLEVGSLFVCIPCLTKSRHEWAERARKAEQLLLDTSEDSEPISTVNAPLGTKAPAIMGGAWCKVEGGWKWNGPDGSGSTFPTPGGDWTGDLIVPTGAHDDAARWKWATSLEDNAETVYSVVMTHGGDQDKINERVDAYRLDATQTPMKGTKE